jgi:predicted  nucleic acid-binding Zn-ribbon protein
VYSRTGKKIQPNYIGMKEQSEFQKDEEVNQFRLQNIALRNRLANKEKVLKKKEQLADGLHLIDFEQLKIENQTLNEKIEERNEELHKLRKKITNTVVILSHTREKLKYVDKQNMSHNEKLEILHHQLNSEKTALSNMKKEREGLQKENQKLKQQTGIVNKKSLKTDYDNREEEIRSLSERIIGLEEYHSRLTKIIERANQVQMAKMTNVN